MNLSKYRLTVAIYEALRNPDGVVHPAALDSPGPDELFKTIWKNTSHNNGLALTATGLEYFIKLLQLEHWDFAVETNTSATILMMERYMTSPYYLTMGKGTKHKKLILFDESVATQLILYGNEIFMIT